MVNYTFIDTGPPVNTNTQNPLHENAICLKRRNKPPGSPPRQRDFPPPRFFEPGNKARWLLLLIPLLLLFYHNKEISPPQFFSDHFPTFYFLFSVCCAIATTQALKAKRRALYNFLYDDPSAYQLTAIEKAYRNPVNTGITPAVCILSGVIHFINYPGYEQHDIAVFLIVVIFFTLIYRKFSYCNVQAKRPELFPTSFHNPIVNPKTEIL